MSLYFSSKLKFVTKTHQHQHSKLNRKKKNRISKLEDFKKNQMYFSGTVRVWFDQKFELSTENHYYYYYASCPLLDCCIYYWIITTEECY